MTGLQVVFLVVATLILAAAVQVVSTRNLVHAALWLIVTLFGMAILFVLLEAGFLAVVQVVVYIGAISILIIFAIMLTRRVMQDSGPQTNSQWWLGGLIALASFGALLLILSRVSFPEAGAAVPDTSLATLGLQLVDPDFYMVPLIVIGVLLAVGMVGSIAIARDDRERE
jgi:NADH-quinone oxidoreductase subunit J